MYMYLLRSIPTQKLKQQLISIHFLSFCTKDFTAINLPCGYGVRDSCCQTQLQNIPKQFVKRYKWHRTVLNWFVDQAQQKFNRDGLLPLYFNIGLPEPFALETIPQVSIIVSRTWKLRFTSNSISGSGTRLEDTCTYIEDLTWVVICYEIYEKSLRRVS